MYLRPCGLLAITSATLLFSLLPIPVIRGDNVLEADGPGQSKTSTNQTFATSTAQPAVLAIHGGTILSFGDRVSVLPPEGVTALQAQGIGSRITSENSNILASGFGVFGARSLDGGLVILDDAKIEIGGGAGISVLTLETSAGADAENGGLFEINGGTITTQGGNQVGLFATDQGKLVAGGVTMTTSGLNAYGAFAQRGGTIALNPGTVIQTSGKGSYGIFAANGGSITGNGVNVTTSGGLGVLLNTADGVAASTGILGPGTVTLQNSTVTAAGPGANGLFASGDGSSIALINSSILSLLGNGASVNDGARLTLSGSSLTALNHGVVATGGTAAAPNSVNVSGGNLITVLGDAFQVQNGATNINIGSGATVTGNSAFLRVLDQSRETVVNMTASRASLLGDIFADPASQTAVNLTDHTILTGRVNPSPQGLGVDLRIDGSSEWNMTGSSNLKSLGVRSGASAVFSPTLADVRHTLTIGSLIGTDATFGMNIDLRRGVGDLIDITGSSDGSHLLTFSDRGHGTDLRSNEALLLVETPDGVAGFSGMTDRAVYKYYVVHGNGSSATPNPDDWYLVRADKITGDQVMRPDNLPAGSVNTPVGLSSVDALSNSANAAIGTYAAGIPLFYADMDTLIQRLGDLRLLAGEGHTAADSNGKAIMPAAPPSEAPPELATWVNGFGSGMHINDQASRAFDQTTGGFQLGADKRFSALQGDLYVGGFLSYFNASRNFLDGGNGSTNALSVGAYATWMHPKGWYADLVLKYTQLWNYFNTPGSDGSVATGDYSIPSFGGSLEVGKRFDFGRFFLEPQAQLAGVWEAGNDYSASNGLAIGEADQFSLRGRLGMRAGMDFVLSNGMEIEPYLKVSAVHEFLTGNQITLNETGFNPTLSGTSVDAAAGIAARVSRSVYLYGEYDYANGDKIRQPWAVNAGVRLQWGGRPEETAVVGSPSVKQAGGKEVEAKVVETTPAKTAQPWQITIGGPGWLAGVSGHTGFRGVNPYVDNSVIEILRHTNAISTLFAEVRNGRFSVLGDYLYLNAQGGTGEMSGLVSKVDVSLQQFIGEFFGSYRLLEGPHGWLDLLGGFRFTYLGEQVGLQANNMAIGAASTNLVDQFAQQLATPNSDLRTLIQQNIVDRLSSLKGAPNSSLPVGPLAGGQPGKIRDSVQQVIANQEPELAAAIQAGAQAKVNQIKGQLVSQVSAKLTQQLSRSISFYDSWTDPVIGLRGRYNLNKAFYLTAETDLGGFGISSDIAVQAYAALGCQLTRSIFSEVGYRYLYDDFHDEGANDFLYQLSLHGAQITVGITF
jgi:outer membrane autotransporter protein